ncbi:hypothetical protein DQP55_25410, partial [Mycolicibacterium sp. GF69]|uniref:hypothetical protein n=1 Tax=Mycolicibacterium sp. GF69 TaxID=2267251 RepID=UPI000DCB7517
MSNAKPPAVDGPADAPGLTEWVDPLDEGRPVRYFRGTERRAAGIRIQLAGRQQSDGTLERQAAIIAEGRRQPVQSSELRALASAALAPPTTSTA